jgi:hypothetical protein
VIIEDATDYSDHGDNTDYNNSTVLFEELQNMKINVGLLSECRLWYYLRYLSFRRRF